MLAFNTGNYETVKSNVVFVISRGKGNYSIKAKLHLKLSHNLNYRAKTV